MNQLFEYLGRHGHQSLPICHNGTVFFNDAHNKPACVVLTSLPCRCFSSCLDCDNLEQASVIVEVFYPEKGGTFSQVTHDHVDPSTDLMTYMRSQGLGAFRPAAMKNLLNIEGWLWDFTTQSLKLRAFKAVSGETFQAREQIVHAALKQPRIFNAYFLIYEAFALSRKYLMFG